MENLVSINNQGRDVTTSMIIAEVFGKDHDKVCRDIENLDCPTDFNTANFGDISYHDSMNRERKAYEITKDGFSFLVMGYTGAKAAEFKIMFINEFNRRESLLKSDDYILARSQEILTGRVKSLEIQLNHKSEQIAIQENVIKEQAPKVEYYDTVLKSEGLIPINMIATELGMSAIKLNQALHALKIIYRLQDTWLLYSEYRGLGYAKLRTIPYLDSNGKQQTRQHMYWTEAGRKFIHENIEHKINESNDVNKSTEWTK